MAEYCIIFSGGDMPEISFETARELQDSADLIICADSGLRHALKYGIKPDIIVGDFDSYTDKLPENCEILRSVPEKDDTDTLLAVRKAIELGCTEIDLYGALGGSRFEHTAANIQTMLFAHEHGCRLNICAESRLMLQYPEDDVKIYEKPQNDCYFSVFAMSNEVHVDFLKGTKYPLENYIMTNAFPIGVSNEFSGDRIELRISEGVVLIILTLKATPHKDCAAETQSDFSSDCTEIL